MTNRLEIGHHAGSCEIEREVKKAFERLADLDARSVWATVDGSVVTLHGSVHSFRQRQSAARAAETAPGVGKVMNHILVLPEFRD